MARWQSGYAADCKSVDLGSTPGRAPYKRKPSRTAGLFFRLSSVNVKFDFLTGRPRSSSSLYYYLFSKSVFETVPYLAELHIPISFFFAQS